MQPKNWITTLFPSLVLLSSGCLLTMQIARAQTVLVEAESFQDHGGWKPDTQFIEIMGSSYLLAHGLGQPVADATTTVDFPVAGSYRVFVRTKDWVAPWSAPGRPGKFELVVDDKPLSTVFGAESRDWFWQDGGSVSLAQGPVRLRLRDLTGFDGRCDAILFTRDPVLVPPNNNAPLAKWRRELLGLAPDSIDAGPFDLVVVGGGYAGMASAISAARLGCRVALIQNRPVLGGNGSSEIRVWANGETRRGLFPRLGEIVEEFTDRATLSPGTYEEFGDAKKEQVVRAEPNLTLFLNHHVYRIEQEGNRLTAVIAIDTQTSEERRFSAPLFADCTGHGTIGFLAGADHTMQEQGHLGMSNMWRWDKADRDVEFPLTPWALQLEMKDFPYPVKGHGQWFWESGFDADPIEDLELIRDWNLRAVFGAFNAMKNGDGRDRHGKAYLTWIAYIGGNRESRQLIGDVILTREDIVEKRAFVDGCVPTTWDIDLHYPAEQFLEKYPNNPYISYAQFDKRVDRNRGYPVPYRCFYSRNIENLFMAGRCVSVTHEALGTVRVMRTGGMMGEVVGKAAALCTLHDTTPRTIYREHLDELKELMRLPGVAHRHRVTDPIIIPPDASKQATGTGSYVDPASLSGMVMDSEKAQLAGEWKRGTTIADYIGEDYLYLSPAAEGEATFRFRIPATGLYEVRIAFQPHANRSTQTPVTVFSAARPRTVHVNQRQPAPMKYGFLSLGIFPFEEGKIGSVTFSNEGVDGYIHVDAVQILPATRD